GGGHDDTWVIGHFLPSARFLPTPNKWCFGWRPFGSGYSRRRLLSSLPFSTDFSVAAGPAGAFCFSANRLASSSATALLTLASSAFLYSYVPKPPTPRAMATAATTIPSRYRLNRGMGAVIVLSSCSFSEAGADPLPDSSGLGAVSVFVLPPSSSALPTYGRRALISS